MYTLDGLPVLSAEAVLRRSGAWVAEVDVDATERDPADGPLQLVLGALRLTGTPLPDRSGSSLGRWRGILAGGSGRWREVLPPASYRVAPLRLPLTKILEITGDTLASTSSSEVLGTMLPAWTRDRATAGSALRRLAREASSVWRTLPDGTVWIGRDDFFDVTQDVPHELAVDDAARGRVLISTDDPHPLLLPGTSFRGLRVERVIHRIGRGSTRTEVRSDSDGGALASFVERSMASGGRYLARHWARVVAQSADGRTVDVVPDSDDLPTYPEVPIAVPLPGATLRVPNGARVLLAFAGGDAQSPYVAGWEHGAADLELDGVSGYAGKAVARVDDTATAGTLRFTLAAAPAPPAPPGSQLLTVTYSPPGVSVPSIFSLLLPPGTSAVFPPSGDLPIELRAIIDSGCAGVLS